MIAIKAARKFIQAHPGDPQAQILAQFVLALESESSCPLGDLYRLEHDRFQLALAMLAEWRIDRYYASKTKLLDLSWQLRQLEQAGLPS